MRPGDFAAFPAGDPNGHHFLNRSDREARFLVMGTRPRTRSPPIPTSTSMVEIEGGKASFTYRDGTPWTGPR